MSESTNPTDDPLGSSKLEDTASRAPKEGPQADRLDAAKRVVDRAYLDLGRELYLEFSTDRFKAKGFTSFDDFARSKGVEPGRARRLRRVFKHFQKDLGVPYETLAVIGYENVCAIMPVINKGNKSEWLKKAGELPYDDLIKEVETKRPPRVKRKVVAMTARGETLTYSPEDPSKVEPKLRPSADGKTDAADDIVYVKTLYLVGQQNTVFETALENIERRTGSTKVGYLLSCALMEYLTHQATKDTDDDGRMKYYMAVLESRYGGRLMWIKDKKVAEEMSDLIGQAESSATEQDQAGPQPLDAG